MITIHNYEAFAIDYIEGELSLTQMAEMENLLAQHPALRSEFAALTENWSSLVLAPDEAIVFSDTSKLLKPLLAPKIPIVAPLAVATRSLTAKYLRIAAVSVGILFGVGALYQFLPTNQPTDFAQNTPVKPVDTYAKSNENLRNKEKEKEKENVAKNAVIEAEKAATKTPTIPVFTENNTTLAQTNTGKNATKKPVFAEKSNEYKTIEPKTKNENIAAQKTENTSIHNSIKNNSINSNNSINTNNAVADNTIQRSAIELIDDLPTVRLQDFYFETAEDYTETTLFSSAKPVFLAKTTKNTRKNSAVLNALLPESTIEPERNGSLWKAFLPEGAKENNTNLASIADAFRPSR